MNEAAAQPDDQLHSLGGKEGVTEDRVRLLPDPVNTTGPLDEANDGPGEVVINDSRTVLEVLPLG